MSAIHKLTKNGSTIFPASTTDAIVHPSVAASVTDMIKEYNVSELFPTEGIDDGTVYTLDLAISVLGAHLRDSEKCGGIKLIFLERTKDKFNTYILVSSQWSDDPNDWNQVPSSVVQGLGTSTVEVMSQNAVNDALIDFREELNRRIDEIEPTIVEGDVTNAADEEDLTDKDSVLKFKDKDYNPLVYSGLGRVYIRKNIVDGVNLLTQSMFLKENTVYYIQYDYTVVDVGIQIPSGCILNFIGGKLQGGPLVSNSTIIIDSYNTKPIENIDIYGYFKYYSIFDCYTKEEISEFIYNKEEINQLIGYVVSLDSKPTRDTLTFVNDKGETINFKLGDRVRVKDTIVGLEDTNYYVYYELYDIDNNEAYWRIYSPVDLTENAFIHDTGYGSSGTKKYITSYDKTNIFPYTKDDAVLDQDGVSLQTRYRKLVSTDETSFSDAQKSQARTNIDAAKNPEFTQVEGKSYYEANF